MINICAIQGRLCNEPELKSSSNGVSVCRFTLACDRNYQPQGKEREADFIDIVAFKQRAEFVSKWFHKGDLMALEGSIQTRNYEKDGQKRKSVEVIANNISFCESKKAEQKSDDISFTEIGSDDDLSLPF